MKKIFLATAVFTILSLTAAFAKGNDEINKQVTASFQKDFVSATQVKWEKSDSYVKATFQLNSQVLFAYYKQDGELLAVVRNILSDRLPIELLSDIKKNYNSYWITNLFEIATDDQTSYYISLESDSETIILKSSGSNVWTTYKRMKKNLA